MNFRHCTCTINANLSDAALDNFYAQNFIPRKWALSQSGPLTNGALLHLNGYCKSCGGDLEVVIPVTKCDSIETAFQSLYDAICTLHPHDKVSETDHGDRFYYGGCKERSTFYTARDKMSLFRRNTKFLDMFSEYDREQAHLWLEKKFPPQTHREVFRDTGGSLFSTAIRMAKENGDYDRAAEILDYVLPNEQEGSIQEPVVLTSYEFDFIPTVNFGGSEGIYLTCSLLGKFDESSRYRINVGTAKTLRTDLEAMKIMGELGGALAYHANRYVNQNLHRYTPDRELEAEEKRQKEKVAQDGQSYNG